MPTSSFISRHKTYLYFDFPITAIKSDVYKFLAGHKTVYDIIVADPPYNFTQEQFEEIVSLVFENELLNENGMMVAKHSKYT